MLTGSRSSIILVTLVPCVHHISKQLIKLSFYSTLIAFQWLLLQFVVVVLVIAIIVVLVFVYSVVVVVGRAIRTITFQAQTLE